MPDPEQLRREQARRERAEHVQAEAADLPEDEHVHERRADKAAYLKDKLADARDASD